MYARDTLEQAYPGKYPWRDLCKIYIYTYIQQQQQQVLQKCTGPQTARASLGGPVNLSVGNA